MPSKSTGFLLLQLLLLSLSLSAAASCPGMTGDAALRCNCHESQLGLPPEAFSCTRDRDCIAVEGSCADWAVLSRAYFAKLRTSFKNSLPTLKLTPEPRVFCRQNTCLSGNPATK